MIDTQSYTAIQESVFNETFYRYNTMGEQSEVLDPTGDITETNYNALGLTASVYVGTSDGTVWPGEYSAPASNMVQVSADAYNADGLPLMSVADNLNLQETSTSIDAGAVAVSSTTSGSGFLMYRAQNVQSRFGAAGGSESFIAVAYVDGQWEYDNGSGLCALQSPADRRAGGERRFRHVRGADFPFR